MRKITSRIKEAFYRREPLTISNTRTDGKAVWLHGNKIIERREDGLYATLAGWNTNVTKERLNGILRGASISTIKGSAYLVTKEGAGFIDSHEWFKVN